jgi:F-type H+-transporting ATPase subunit delta
MIAARGDYALSIEWANGKLVRCQIDSLLGKAARFDTSEAHDDARRFQSIYGRVAVLPDIATQYRALVNAQGGVSDATIHSAFPMKAAQVEEILPSLEKRFGRKLNAQVVVEPALIGGIRVVVGDEVLDASVKARLEQMKAALTV